MPVDTSDPPSAPAPPAASIPRPRPVAFVGGRAVRGPAEPVPDERPPVLDLPEASRFQPREPRSWEEAGIDPALGEQLVLRYLLVAQQESGRQIATDTCLAYPLIKELLEALKFAKFVQHRGATAMGDFIFELTDAGRGRAFEYRRLCAYVGPAPVPFAQYLVSLREHSLAHRRPTAEDLVRAFSDLHVPREILARLGPALTSGRSLFLHGDPGNGKTSLAERITRCYGDTIWIPQTLDIGGHLVKLYDPAVHEIVEAAFKPVATAERLDRRWIKIKRPTVIAGGELTLDMLEIQANPQTNVCEAPLQLKGNCGTLVIDDFGRQRIPVQELLNRWIFPLERRVDFLKLPDGRKITAPFEALLIFSTNLEPRDLVDEAFLRRIPYKIRVDDPSPDDFRTLLEDLAARLDVYLPAGSVAHLIERHYLQPGRPMRYCHPRDLLMQVVHQCAFERRRGAASTADWDRAVRTYFGTL